MRECFGRYRLRKGEFQRDWLGPRRLAGSRTLHSQAPHHSHQTTEPLVRFGKTPPGACEQHQTDAWNDSDRKSNIQFRSPSRDVDRRDRGRLRTIVGETLVAFRELQASPSPARKPELPSREGLARVGALRRACRRGWRLHRSLLRPVRRILNQPRTRIDAFNSLTSDDRAIDIAREITASRQCLSHLTIKPD